MSQLSRKIVEEIQNQGAIRFARFMELALYCPVYGYYEKEGDTIGAAGDFYTSVSVGSLFGELLAFQFSQWIEEWHKNRPSLDTDSPKVFLVEAGAHRGTLAKDILNWTRDHRPSLFERLHYWIIDPSELRQQYQREKLVEFVPRIRWARDLSQLDLRGFVIIFANELLDALPVRRFGWDAVGGIWFEWGVGLDDGRFVWKRLPAEQSSIGEPQGCVASTFRRFEPITNSNALPDGYILEICPAATQWWALAAKLLPTGKLITIDYGWEEEELIDPNRSAGTLRAYYRHQQSAHLLEQPGEQDITAHIDFSEICKAGENAGLQTEALMTQARFLTAIAARTWDKGAQFGEWTPGRRRQLQTLTHPEHLGRAFRVLVQSR